MAPESKQIKANLGRLGSFTKKQSLIRLISIKDLLLYVSHLIQKPDKMYNIRYIFIKKTLA